MNCSPSFQILDRNLLFPATCFISNQKREKNSLLSLSAIELGLMSFYLYKRFYKIKREEKIIEKKSFFLVRKNDKNDKTEKMAGLE